MVVLDRFEPFSERAKEALKEAEDAAHGFNHNYLGPEHILLGLIANSDNAAAKVLATILTVSLLDLNALREKTVSVITDKGQSTTSEEPGLTPRAKRIIVLAVESAHHLEHAYIATAHILIAILKEGEGIAAEVLNSVGVGVADVEAEYVSLCATAANRISEAVPLTPYQQVCRALIRILRNPHSLEDAELTNIADALESQAASLREIYRRRTAGKTE